MVIFWRGYGPLVILFAILAVVIASYSSNSITNDQHFAATHLWVNGIALVISGVLSFIVGIRLNGGSGRVLVDPKTRQRLIYKKKHDIFFIPMQYWAIVVIIVGGCMIFCPHVFDKHSPAPATNVSGTSQ